MSEEITTSASDGLLSLPAIQDIAATYKLSAKAFAFTFRAIAMPTPHTEAEFVSCCLVAGAHGLNPLTKEIYFMRDQHGKMQAIVGIDGWIKKCNEHPQFDGMEFDDHFDDGKIHSVTCRIFRKDRSRPTQITEYFSECVQVRSKPGPWQTHPNRFTRHRALQQCARVAFGFAGIMDRDEFDQWQGMRDITPPKAAIPELPDIPDEPAAVQDEPDTPITDADGFLAKLEDDIHLCDTEAELDEIRVSNADIIKRLPQAARKRAEELVGPPE